MTPISGYLNGKFKKSPRGMGVYTLCKECNNKTGGWYVESYVDFSNQVMGKVKVHLGQKTEFDCKIKPLNFIKQVVCLLLSSDQATGVIREVVQRTNFILNKEEQKLEDLLISMNITLQPFFGFKGYTVAWESNTGFTSNAEFVYRPFHFRAAFERSQVADCNIDLLPFLDYGYNEEAMFKIDLDLTPFTLQQMRP